MKPIETAQNVALIMPGGGARAAYQVGVLKGLSEITGPANPYPFSILCGTSAGAINAVALSSREDNFINNCRWLESLWNDLNYQHVYRSDWIGLLRNAWRLVLSLVNAGIAVGRPVALLDNLPLKQLLRSKIDFAAIGKNIKAGRLDAVCVTAMNYTENKSVTFFQGGPENSEWQHWRRQGVPTPLQLRHLMASTAMPTIFPPQRVGRNYYGDGALRQLSPISPALHLGADKILIIGTTGHKKEYIKPYRRIHSPAFGQVLGHLLNSAFVDSLESDIEMLERMNELIAMIPEENFEGRDTPKRCIDNLIISPSEDIDTLAENHVKELPSSIRTFLSVTGSSSYEGGVNVASYLLFTESFCRELMKLGYRDAISQRKAIAEFMAKPLD